MKKLNNKGLTIVELIITFALLMILVVGLLEIVLESKSDISDKSFAKEMNEYKGLMIKTVQDDLIKKKLKSADTTNCTLGTECVKLTFEDNTIKTLIVDLRTKMIKYDSLFYEIPNKKYIEFRDERTMTLADESNYRPVSIQVNSQNILVIDIPYFRTKASKNMSEVDKNYNYGIKIVHPL